MNSPTAIWTDDLEARGTPGKRADGTPTVDRACARLLGGHVLRGSSECPSTGLLG